MHWIDWIVLVGSLMFIVLYGIWKTRTIRSTEAYLLGDKEMPYWVIGLSIMATQASAITFLSTPGQAYSSGMGFVQFYFGLPIAMVILAVFILPLYHRMKVYTAYEYLESRLGLPSRVLTASLFLVQRGLAAGITIYAPAIILSAIMGWNLSLTCLVIGILVIAYTVLGGSQAVSQTQKQQMFVIMAGMVTAFVLIVSYLSDHADIGESLLLAGDLGKMEIVNFDFDLSNRYTVWSALLGGTFLFLSYFGTDQSQVQRYLSGKSLSESRMGLVFNGFFKIPMQFFILLTGVLVFTFFQFEKSPLHFNPVNLQAMQLDETYKEKYDELEKEYDLVFAEKKSVALKLVEARRSDNNEDQVSTLKSELQRLDKSEMTLRNSAKNLIADFDKELEVKDSDYVFIYFILKYLPIGVIGLLIAVIFSAAMSSTASELNALATTTVIDIYKRNIVTKESDAHYLSASKWFTALWGVIALVFALFASLFENLIEGVNIIGSLFYGNILGIFLIAFFLKKISGQQVFISAIITQILVILVFLLDRYEVIELAYLWLNLLGCLCVISIASLFSFFAPNNIRMKHE